MGASAPEISKEEHRALWLEVVRWPLKGGMLGGVLLLALASVALAYLEGGSSESARETRSYLGGAVSVVALMILGHYAWRSVACTSPTERPVPWGADDADPSSFFQRISTFAGVFAVAFLPVLAWVTLQGRIAPAVWLYWVVVVVASLAGAAVFPLGLAGAVAAGSALGAAPWRILRMWRANPQAARVAATSALVFVGMFVASAVLADAFVSKPKEIDYLAAPSSADTDMVGPALRWTLVVLRAGGFYAALVSCRVAGLLAREVPGMAEAAR